MFFYWIQKNFIFDEQSFIEYAKKVSDKDTRLEVSCITSSIGDFLKTEADIYYVHFGEIKKPSSETKTFLEVLDEQFCETSIYVIIASKEFIEILNNSFLKRENVVFYETNRVGGLKDV